MKNVSIIRDRGQLTIPDKFRDSVDWLYPNSVVSLSLLDNESLVITPAKPIANWNKINALRAKLRNSAPQSSTSALSFLRKDRQSH